MVLIQLEDQSHYSKYKLSNISDGRFFSLFTVSSQRFRFITIEKKRTLFCDSFLALTMGEIVQIDRCRLPSWTCKLNTSKIKKAPILAILDDE